MSSFSDLHGPNNTFCKKPSGNVTDIIGTDSNMHSLKPEQSFDFRWLHRLSEGLYDSRAVTITYLAVEFPVDIHWYQIFIGLIFGQFLENSMSISSEPVQPTVLCVWIQADQQPLIHKRRYYIATGSLRYTCFFAGLPGYQWLSECL